MGGEVAGKGGREGVNAERPLAGVRVLDLTRVFSGPFSTMMLAELGAEVVKVEHPDGGDETREWPPFLKDQSGYFFALNRSKRSVAVNLRDPRGQAVLHRLVAGVDVVVENFTPGVVERLAADYPTLRAVNPRLIYCSITGYGQDGPYRVRKAYDPVVQAQSGVMGLTGYPDGPPAKCGIPVGDIAPGMYAALSIVSALYWRKRSGEGQYIDIAMLDCGVAWLTVQAAIYLGSGEVPRRMGSEHPGRVPTAVFLAADGRYIHIACNDAQWPQLCTLLDLVDIGRDARYAKTRQRTECRQELMPRLQAALLQRSASEWDDLLSGAGIPCGIVYDLGEVFANPQTMARGVLSHFEFPGLGAVRAVRLPIRYETLETGIKSRPPVLGEHSQEVLREAGLSADEVHALTEAGIVAQPAGCVSR